MPLVPPWEAETERWQLYLKFTLPANVWVHRDLQSDLRKCSLDTGGQCWGTLQYFIVLKKFCDFMFCLFSLREVILNFNTLEPGDVLLRETLLENVNMALRHNIHLTCMVKSRAIKCSLYKWFSIWFWYLGSSYIQFMFTNLHTWSASVVRCYYNPTLAKTSVGC